MTDMKDLTQIQGIGDGIANKLRDAGICNIMSLAVMTPGQLVDLIGGSETGSRKMINRARELCAIGFENGKTVEEKELPKIPTGSNNIDKLLGGGLELGTSLEAYGEGATGKTALSHALAVSCIKQYPNSYVIWVDSENTFRPSRIRDFCVGFEVDPEHVLQHVLVAKALTSDHQILLTENVEKEINNGKDIKLLIIDSLMNHFRAEYLGRGTLAGRQQMLNGYLHRIGKLCDIYKIAVYLTNQVQSDPGTMFGNAEKVVGGNIVSHFATNRVRIRKAAQGTRCMILVDSPNLPPGEAFYNIGANSLEDIEVKTKSKEE